MTFFDGVPLVGRRTSPARDVVRRRAALAALRSSTPHRLTPTPDALTCPTSPTHVPTARPKGLRCAQLPGSPALRAGPLCPHAPALASRRVAAATTTETALPPTAAATPPPPLVCSCGNGFAADICYAADKVSAMCYSRMNSLRLKHDGTLRWDPPSCAEKEKGRTSARQTAAGHIGPRQFQSAGCAPLCRQTAAGRAALRPPAAAGGVKRRAANSRGTPLEAPPPASVALRCAPLAA